MTVHDASARPDRRVVLLPTRDDLVDAGFSLALMACALIGFRTTYSGSAYLIVGLVGVVLGIAIGHLANVLRQPMIAVAAMTLAVFFLAGGAVALRDSAIGGVLPSGSTFHGLASESVSGWKQLLTTLPPVASSGPLIVLPYLLGLLGGVAAYCLARRTASSLSPVSAPFVILGAVILLGTAQPAARLVQGGVFAVVALAWAAFRSNRRRVVNRTGSANTVRLATAVGLLALAGVAGLVLGPHLPGVDQGSRTVLRSYVHPPVDLDRYPSPLAGFRKYRQPAEKNTVLFSVSGLPAGTPVRIATLDAYDGSVWTATNGTADTTTRGFQRVGDPVPAPRPGRAIAYTVTLPANGYSDVWLPTAGEITGIRFVGADAADRTSAFRYNLSTGTGLVLDGLGAGDRYTVDAQLPSTAMTSNFVPASGDQNLEDDAAFLSDKAAALGGTAGSPYARLQHIANLLRNGYYSDGILPGQMQFLPGHFRTQMLRFLSSATLVGDDEQYASAFALLADSDSIGIPARVVLGAFPEQGVVRARDVRAWVQLEGSDGVWRDVLPNTFMPDPSKAPHQKPLQTQPRTTGQKVPPPVASHPKGDQLDASAVNSSSSKDRKAAGRHHGGFTLPGWVTGVLTWGGVPLLVVLALAATIIGLKALRRRRRRTGGSPATRLTLGWVEVVDHARDLGARAVSGRTRREQADDLHAHDLGSLARAADARVFGADVPDDSAAAEFWAQVDATRRRMSAAVSRRRRILGAVNLASLRRPGAGRAGTT